jgi:cobaltochelatase CobN
LLPGDDQPDAELDTLSTLPREARHQLWQYAVHGGIENARNLLGFAASLIGREHDWRPPSPLMRAGLYWPGYDRPALDDLAAEWRAGAPAAGLIFYRALVQAANVAPVDALIDALRAKGLNPCPIFVSSLKDPVSAEIVRETFAAHPPAVILNATGFAVSTPGAARSETPFDDADCPVLQVVFAGSAESVWRARTNGLSPRDLAMNVVLPEVDGRVLSRAVSFKTEARYDELSEISLAAYAPVPDRIDFVAALAAKWAKLRATKPADLRIGLVLANYPNRDGRLGNGVGLDTPASVVGILGALSKAGYAVGEVPADGNALMARFLAGPTNALEPGVTRGGGERLSLEDYEAFFATLPVSLRDEVTERWGAPATDPYVDGEAFVLAVHRFGNVAIGVQPARGYNIDPAESYHDPALVPPHAYFAFYAWLRGAWGADAVIHAGKHGNLEWLPGKAVALSEACYPEAALGAMPHLYPFIVNDPGEGSQAKRRSSAVIIDHLTPPLTRAESYGPLKDLEQLVDEYYEAAGVDPRRLDLLRKHILELSQSIGLDKDCGIDEADGSDEALAKLDNYLCELKEMQIRDGLHILGMAPSGRLLTDLLVALVRVPRGAGEGADASLIRALAADLELGEFDPLDCEMGGAWSGPRPEALPGDAPWRSNGDTVERLEELAAALIAGERMPDPNWARTRAVLDHVAASVRPAVEGSGAAELKGLLAGLDGRFVEPGPSGAPTRGRLDTLPTGRNFYSVDNRTVPTPAAWMLGWKSASLLVDRHRQEHGAWPRSMALSAWGTANMRTGGDDIAQALALMGVQPSWDAASRRVTGFEIMPVSVLGRPRVDVTLRVSGFFRDAFPSQIDLFDSAVRAVAALDEGDRENPIAARFRADRAAFVAKGMAAEDAERRAGYRVFGSKPGAYGAGLQALIDERGWDSDADLARAYIAWGGYAYGSGAAGAAEHGLFESRLQGVEAVVHNQDNREHDLLDSDDYYQFEGGIAAAVRHVSGAQPAIYHNDHSRPETPKVRTLGEEIARVVRARVVNPKWIGGVMRHGYKGAFEIAATVDYLFAFAATARVVADHHFDAVYDAFIADDRVRGFIEENNPAAAREIAERLVEAEERELWRPKSNSAGMTLRALAGRAGEAADMEAAQ